MKRPRPDGRRRARGSIKHASGCKHDRHASCCRQVVPVLTPASLCRLSSLNIKVPRGGVRCRRRPTPVYPRPRPLPLFLSLCMRVGVAAVLYGSSSAVCKLQTPPALCAHTHKTHRHLEPQRLSRGQLILAVYVDRECCPDVTQTGRRVLTQQ